MIKWTGERYVPWIINGPDIGIHYEHLHRYRFAKEFVRNKRVLDLACGEGYGTSILSDNAQEVIGIDIDDITIRHATSAYVKENLRFIKGSIINIPIEGNAIFDVIICFEAIEHIAEHEQLMQEVKRLIKSGGIFIVSTPNKSTYSDLPHYHNAYHIKEMYFEEFKTLLTHYFKYVLFYGQMRSPTSTIFSLKSANSSMARTTHYSIERGEKEFVFVPPEKKEAHYFIAITSDYPIDVQIGMSYLTNISFVPDQSDEIARLKTIENSLSWRIIRKALDFLDILLWRKRSRKKIQS